LRAADSKLQCRETHIRYDADSELVNVVACHREVNLHCGHTTQLTSYTELVDKVVIAWCELNHFIISLKYDDIGVPNDFVYNKTYGPVYRQRMQPYQIHMTIR